MSGTSGDRLELQVEMEARAEGLSGLRRAARAWMDAVAVPPDVSADVQVALSEAVTNAVLHAYPSDAPGPVRVRGRRLGDELEFVVEDDGRWRDREPGHDGRGLGIIAALSTFADVQRHDGGSQVIFRRSLTTAPGTS